MVRLLVDHPKQAAEALAAKEGNLLLATGAKELAQFAAIPPERLYPRVLPTLESITACEAANIPHRNIIAMQGPFSFALNQAMMEQFHIRWLVTKDGGAAASTKKPPLPLLPGRSWWSSAARPSRARRLPRC